jgi:hypothetical protein
MSQRPAVIEELSETQRLLRQSVEALLDSYRVPDTERAVVRAGFDLSMRQVRLANLLQAAGFRLIRTGRVDKNLATEFRAFAQTESRLLDFPTAAQRTKRQASGGDPDAA